MLKQGGFIGVLRQIREVDPPKRSATVEARGPATTHIALARSATPRELLRIVRGAPETDREAPLYLIGDPASIVRPVA